MRVYMMIVGNRDPFWKEQNKGFITFPALLEGKKPDPDRVLALAEDPTVITGPILSFLEAQRGEIDDEARIVLISTKGKPSLVQSPTYECGEAIRMVLTKQRRMSPKRVIHLPLKNVDPSNLERVYFALREKVQEVLKSIRAEAEDDLELVVNVSPGTPQMQTAWYLMAHFGQIHASHVRLLQTKYLKGKTKVMEVALTPLLAEEYLETGMRFLEAYGFQTAAELFEAAAQAFAPYDPTRAARVEWVSQLGRMWHLWSVFRHSDAAALCSRLLHEGLARESSFVQELLEAQGRVLQELQKLSLKERALNAYHLARLERARHDGVASITRVGMAYECILIERVLREAERRSGFRPDPFDWKGSIERRISTATNPQEQQRLEQFRDECKRSNIWRDFLGVMFLKGILKKWDQEFKQDPFWEGAEGDLSQVRNLVLHRMKPLEDVELNHALEICRQALFRTFGRDVLDDLQQFPLSLERLRDLHDRLKTWLRS